MDNLDACQVRGCDSSPGLVDVPAVNFDQACANIAAPLRIYDYAHDIVALPGAHTDDLDPVARHEVDRGPELILDRAKAVS
ncbi:MAG: hypothetical protein GEV07_29005 [Streptosporangiales bacterium]|nr:hypothetical protein [Streptosporangiales bacterium]